MSNSLFRRKDINKILSEGGDDPHGGSHGLHRVLTMKDLTFLALLLYPGSGKFQQLAVPSLMAGRVW